MTKAKDQRSQSMKEQAYNVDRDKDHKSSTTKAISLISQRSVTMNSLQGRFQLTAYTEADWAGCPVTRRSTSGYCVFLVDNLLSWSAKRQVTLSRSSAEAEYRGVANVVAETA
ncbi:ribonuclease H-like domain-containing protein [Tanacetum coccineum]